jgi:hypothetical protein
MTFLDVVKLAGAIMTSLGGAGAILFGLSGFLGKLWADRAIEDQSWTATERRRVLCSIKILFYRGAAR